MSIYVNLMSVRQFKPDILDRQCKFVVYVETGQIQHQVAATT